MTETTPTTPTPPEGLTDARLLELMPEQFRADLATASRLAAQDAGPDIKPGVFRVILNTGALAYARAAIAAHEAARPAPSPVADITQVLAGAGVFKGSHGLKGLLDADSFWEQQPYGTRLYYGDGIADYLQRGVLRCAVTLLEQFSPTPAPVPSFLDALRLAQGCHDYSGGYGGAEAEAWHAGIGTVVTVLRRAATRPWDSQITAVFAMGADTPAPTPEEIEAQFRDWWKASYPSAPVGNHSVRSHVAFALHLFSRGVQ